MFARPTRATLATVATWLVAVYLGEALRLQDSNVAAWWPAVGVAVGGLRLAARDQRGTLLGLLTAASLAGALAAGYDVDELAVFALLTPGQAWVGAEILRRLSGDEPWWTSRDHVIHVIIAGGVVGLVGATLATAAARNGAEAIPFWVAWAGGDMLGLLTALPALEALRRHGGQLDPPTVVAGAVLGVSALHLAILALLIEPFDLAALGFVAPAMLIVIATRAGPQAVSLAVVALTTTAVAVTSAGSGALSQQSETARVVQLAVVFGSFAALALAATATAIDRRRTEGARDRALGLLDLAFDGAPVPLAMLTPDGVIVRANTGLAALAGAREPNDLAGRDLAAMVAPDDRAGVAAALRACSGSNGPPRSTNLDVRLPREGVDGDRDVALTIAPVRTDERAPHTLLASLVDVTARARTSRELQTAVGREQAATARLRELDTLRDTFVRAISHDLRTPLAPLLGLSDLLATRHDQFDAEQIKVLASRIAHNGRRVRRLLDDLDDLNRLGVGIDDNRRITTDAAQVIREAVEAATDDQHPLSMDLTPTTVTVDAITLRRIAHNLVANAMNHTPKGTPVRVVLSATTAPRGLELVVEDDGDGVPDDFKERIFADFTQGPGPHTSGSGVGLALVREFARLRNGTAHVEDASSGGARFVVRLPAMSDNGHNPLPSPPS